MSPRLLLSVDMHKDVSELGHYHAVRFRLNNTSKADAAHLHGEISRGEIEVGGNLMLYRAGC